MKLDPKTPIDKPETVEILKRHFDYSMKDVKSYDELTTEEKEIISEEDWNRLMLPNTLDYRRIWDKIVGDLIDYCVSNNLQSLVLGVSGGIDSTVCAAIISEVEKRTLGLKAIGISMPLKNKPDEMTAADLVLKAWFSPSNTHEIPLEPIYDEYLRSLYKYGSSTPGADRLIPAVDDLEEYEIAQKNRTRIANGNIMARIRMTILYDYAGLEKGMVIDTDNLTEHYLGFFTIHGDQGDYKPIGGLWKMEVYGLAQWIYENIATTDNQRESLAASIALIPTDGNGVSSSDLEQIGGDSYDQVDRVLRNHILGEYNNLRDVPKDVQEKIISRYHATEFKRR